LTDTSAALTIGADCRTIWTIGTIGNRWQSATSPCWCCRIRILTEFTELYRPPILYYSSFGGSPVFGETRAKLYYLIGPTWFLPTLVGGQDWPPLLTYRI